MAQNFPPNLVDFVPLAEEAVAANVKQIAFVINRAGDAADNVVALQYDRRLPVLGQFISGSQAGGTTTYDYNPI
jgi:hypothetical protein